MDSDEKDNYVNGSSEDAVTHSVESVPDSVSGNDGEEQIDDAYAEGQYLDQICEKQPFHPSQHCCRIPSVDTKIVQ